MRAGYLDRETSDAIKGIALVFMFIHHFFTFPDFYISGISYPELTLFARAFCWPLKICVSVFAFLTGYFYFFGKQQTFRYSLRKITDILLSYWAVCIPFLILAMALGDYRFELPDFVQELFGLDGKIMIFGWYVSFYCIAMLLLPIAAKFSTNSFGKDVLLLLVFPVAVFVGIKGIFENKLGMESSTVTNVLTDIKEWFPCILSGFLCAKYSVFERFLDELSGRLRSKYTKLLLWLMMAGAAFVCRAVCPRFSLGSIQAAGEWLELTFNMDIFYAPLFVYGVAKFWQFLKGSILSKVLGYLGKQSLLMWFLHCVFFNVCKETTQPILYAPKNPLLVLLFGLILCYALAVLIDGLLKPVRNLKNKYL